MTSSTPRSTTTARRPAAAATRAAAAALLLLALGAASASGQEGITPEEWALAREVVAHLRGADAEGLAELVDWRAHHAEGLLRGTADRAWDDLDDLDRLLAARTRAQGWIGDDPRFLASATVYGVRSVDDPDAGSGAVPDRRILQIQLKEAGRGRLRDALLVLTPGGQVVDLTLGPPYEPGHNPSGEDGLLPLELASLEDAEVPWPPNTDELQRDEAFELVELLLAASGPREVRRYEEYLHRSPRPAVTALLRRLVQVARDDAHDVDTQGRLVDALERITGRSSTFQHVARWSGDGGSLLAGNRAAIDAWVRWHARHGHTFPPAPVGAPLEPTFSERGADGGGEPVARAADGRRAPEPADGSPAPPASGSAPPSDPASAAGEGSPGEEGGPGAGAGPTAAEASPAGPREAEPPPDGDGTESDEKVPPTAGAGGPDAGTDAGTGTGGDTDDRRPKVRLRVPASESAQPGERAAELPLLWGERATTVAQVRDDLHPSVLRLLDDWAETFTTLGLTVVSSGNPDHLVAGLAAKDVLVQAARQLDAAWQIVDPLVPRARDEALRRPVLALLVDQGAARTDAWGEFLAELGKRRLLALDEVDRLRSQPQGIMVRHGALFVQVTWDVAGNAAAGDDEFRLTHELSHKLAQCLLTERCGPLPHALGWALGHLVENRLFDSVYQLDTHGFVASGDHFDWPVRARQLLEKHGKKRGFDLAERVLAGSQRDDRDSTLIAWATLETLAAEHPLVLAELLHSLHDLHALADPYALSSTFRPGPEETRTVLQQALAPLDVDRIARHLKRLD